MAEAQSPRGGGLGSDRLPTLFLSHGAPTLALEGGETGQALSDLGKRLRTLFPNLQGVIVMSPHWITSDLAVTGPLPSPVLHDFSGFPEALHRLDYSTPPSTVATERVLNALKDAGYSHARSVQRGLDHGAWVPLRYIFPTGDLPVVQISMPFPCPPVDYFTIGEALAALSADGYLLIGSGGLTHNLSHYRGQPASAEPLSYVLPFSTWVQQRLEAGDLESLFDYRRRAPDAALAHPTDDHLMPLFFAMGGTMPNRSAKRLHQGVTHALLAMDIYSFGEGADP
jgi:4,5-DOPA dioxygenase extradiol